jgi:ribosomal protein L37AE/L43A
MKEETKKKCIKCGNKRWKNEQIGLHICSVCSNCGYIFDWVDYTTVGKIDASTITVKT